MDNIFSRRRFLRQVALGAGIAYVSSEQLQNLGIRLAPEQVQAATLNSNPDYVLLNDAASIGAVPSGSHAIYSKNGALTTKDSAGNELPQMQPVSYNVYKNSGTYIALNGLTGAIDYGGPNNNGGATGSNASSVLQACINRLPHGGLIHLAANTTFMLTEALAFTFGDPGYPAWAAYNWILEGEGASTIISQNTSGKDAITIKNGTSVGLRNFTINVGSSARHGIYGDGSGSPAASMWQSIVENVWIKNGSSGNCLFYLENPAYCAVRNLYLNSSGVSGVVPFKLYNRATNHFYGNSVFDYIFISGSTNYDGMQISGAGKNGALDLCSFSNLQLIGFYSSGGNKGINIGPYVQYVSFPFVSVEGYDYGVYVTGASDFLTSNTSFLSGYSTGNTSALYCDGYTWLTKFQNMFLSTNSALITDTSPTNNNIYEDLGWWGAGTLSITNPQIFRGAAAGMMGVGQPSNKHAR